MAFSGLGAGTIGDPYQVTSTAQWAEMSSGEYNNTHHFKLMNDLTFSAAPTIALRSNLDGDNHRITFSFAGTAVTYVIMFLASSIYIKNLKFRSLESSTWMPSILSQDGGAMASITLDNLEFELNATEPYSYTSLVTQNIPATWTLSNISIIVNSRITRIFSNVYCNLTNVHAKVLRYLELLSGSFMIQTFYGALIQDCSVSFGRMYIANGGVIANNYAQSAQTVIERCRVTGILEGANAGAILGTSSYYVTIQDCYFNGDLIDWSNNFNNINIGVLSSYSNNTNARYYRNYAYVNNYKKKTLSIRYDPEYFVDSYNYGDWHVPSRLEMELVVTQWSKLSIKFPITGIYFLTSSETDANTFQGYSTGGWSTARDKDGYHALILVRAFNYDPETDPVIVGYQFEGGIVISKDDATGVGMMCQNTPVALGAALFTFGSKGVLLGTSNAVGSGAANTALIRASSPAAQAGVNWQTYEYPVLPNINSRYPLLGYVQGTYANNYSTVINKDAIVQLGNYASYLNNVTPAQLRTVATFAGWDFATVWEQLAADTLPQLRSNPESIYPLTDRVTRTGVRNISTSIVLNTDNISSSAIGLLIKDENNNTVYDAIGTSHAAIVLPAERDYTLTISPFRVIGEVHTPIYSFTYKFYSAPAPEKRYIPATSQITLNLATVGFDAKNVHGSLFYNGHVYGCCRTDGRIVKINSADLEDVTTCLPTSPSAGAISLDQIVLCNGFIWGQAGNVLVRINPTTLAWDSTLITFTGGDTATSEPIASSHDRYLYIASQRYVAKYDSSLMLGTTILADVPSGVLANAKVGEYDSYTQGKHIGWSGPNPGLYTGQAKGRCHSMIPDGDMLYIGYTTFVSVGGVAIDAAGYSSTFETTVHELHKIRLSDMTAVGWTTIPKCTDDMSQTPLHIFMGIEIPAVGSPQAYGYGKSVLAVDKTTLQVRMLKPLDAYDNPPTVISYGSLIFGNYLVDLRTNQYAYIVDISDVNEWSEDQPMGKYTRMVLQFVPSISSPNEVVRGSGRVFSAFGWVMSGSTPMPSIFTPLPMPSALALTSAPYVQTVSAVLI